MVDSCGDRVDDRMYVWVPLGMCYGIIRAGFKVLGRVQGRVSKWGR
jgi:hypothetical protein